MGSGETEGIESAWRVAVIVSCFNRRQITLTGLASLFRQVQRPELTFTVYLVDDGSTDGTAAAVAEQFPAVRVIQGDGSLWWVGAMRKGIDAALSDGYDAYVWWNDDTELVPDALQRLVDTANQLNSTIGPAIIAGSTCDRVSGARTFGGWRRQAKGITLCFLPVNADEEKPIRCDTMNGNFTLIPAAIAERLGNMEPAFQHRLADWDYGLRAGLEGIPVYIAPGYYGYCTPDPPGNTWQDASLSRKARWKQLMSPRGMRPREWYVYTRRHFGWRFPLYFASPYVKVLLGLRA